jgi:aldehyde dehydrogenase (NAD+)
MIQKSRNLIQWSEWSQVVFVLGAWNFPFHLSLAPCIAAIAAGNCVVLKPSDVSPTCAQMLKEA